MRIYMVCLDWLSTLHSWSMRVTRPPSLLPDRISSMMLMTSESFDIFHSICTQWYRYFSLPKAKMMWGTAWNHFSMEWYMFISYFCKCTCTWTVIGPRGLCFCTILPGRQMHLVEHFVSSVRMARIPVCFNLLEI